MSLNEGKVGGETGNGGNTKEKSKEKKKSSNVQR